MGEVQTAKADGSLDDQIRAVNYAWREQIRGLGGIAEPQSYVMEVYPSDAVICDGDDYYRIPYTEGADGVVFDVQRAVPVERTWAEVTKTVTITKTDDARQQVFGWAYVSELDGARVVDHSDEVVDKEDLETAAYQFNLDYREADERHTEPVVAKLIESFMVTDEKLEAMGLDKGALPTGWWTGWYVPDAETYQKIKRDYPMLSIGGRYLTREHVDA